MLELVVLLTCTQHVDSVLNESCAASCNLTHETTKEAFVILLLGCLALREVFALLDHILEEGVIEVSRGWLFLTLAARVLYYFYSFLYHFQIAARVGKNDEDSYLVGQLIGALRLTLQILEQLLLCVGRKFSRRIHDFVLPVGELIDLSVSDMAQNLMG